MPTSPLSEISDPFDTLNWHFGTLTLVWVVPLSGRELTPRPRLPPSTANEDSEFDKVASPLGPLHTESVSLPLILPQVRLD